MSTNYSPGGAMPTFPLSLPEDGELINEAVLVDGILKPIIDGVGLNCTRTYTALQTFGAGATVSAGKLTLAEAPALTSGSGGDSDQTLDVSKPVWHLAAATALRTDTMRSTTAPVPATDQIVKIRMAQGGAAARRIQREDATIICTLGNDANDPACVEVYWSGTVWKLLGYSAHVTPGTGA